MEPPQNRSTPSSPTTMEPFQPSPMDSVQPSVTTNSLALIRETYEETIDPVEQKRPSKRFKSSETINPGYHGSTPYSPPTMESSHTSPVDSIKSMREMYEKMDSEKQIGPLFIFVENQLQKMNLQIPSEAGSTFPDGLLETVENGIDLAARTIDTISTKAEKLSKSEVVEAMRSVTFEVVKRWRDSQWVFMALSVAAFAAERYTSVNSAENECTELLLKILELAKEVKQYAEKMPDDREKLCNAVRTIVEDAVICWDYLQKKFRFWSAKTAAEQLEKTNQHLRDVTDSLYFQWDVQFEKTNQQLRDVTDSLYFQWDVFLSHSGKQKNFVRQLHRDLTRENVSCFFDEDHNSLPFAHRFPPLILKAAETCKTAVVVLSKEFICSKWPMIELSAFISAMKSGKNAKLKLLPIFFMISPKELSHITRDGPEWQNLEVSNDTRDKWQDALKEVRLIKGLPFREGENEMGFRDEVVKEIRCLLKRETPLQLLDFKPVGIEDQVEEVKELMDMEGAQSALAVIVCGFGGVGKSTLAANVVQSLDWSSSNFKFCWVRIDEKAPDKTSHIIKLQKDIIYELGGVKLDLQNPDQGRVRIKEALQKTCSLLLIDNVVDKVYIQDLLPKDLSSCDQKTKLRILITSREKDVKAKLNINCKVHEVRTLSKRASQLLLSHTILQGKVVEDKDLDEKRMINEVADACRGVPLLLSVFGEHLRTDRDKDSYQEALNVLREGNLDNYRDEDLGKRLMFVYHKIKNEEVREAFLDICTYFHGWKWDLVVDIVDLPILKELRRRMLVSKSRSGEVIVHDILRLIGTKDTRLTRFLNYKEFSDALEDNLDGFGNVKGISLVSDNCTITIQSTQLEAMRKSLRVLMLGDWVTLDGQPSDKAFRNLRYLRVGDITAFPFRNPSKLRELRVFVNGSKPGMNLLDLPSSLQHICHEVLDVQCDKFVNLPFQNLSSLKSFIVKTKKSVELPNELHLPASLVDLDLNSCKNLPKDIGHLTDLQSLILDRSDLERLPQGFGKLKKLKHLSMNYCSKLTSLSEELGMLSSLEALSMKNCGNLRALPESFGELRIHSLKLHSLVQLQDLPNSFGDMPLLKHFSLLSCDSLMSLPNSFVQLKMLETLQIEGCAKLSALPEDFGRLLLKDFSLNSCDSLMLLPNSFVQLEMLETLTIMNCTKLSVLPEDFGRLLLKDFCINSCDSLMLLPNSFVQLEMLETLNIMNCTKLSVLPEDFCRLRCLKHMTVEKCHLLKELPHGFGALRALKSFTLGRCNSFVNLPRDFGELSCLEELRLEDLPLLSRIPNGFGKLKNLRFLELGGCFQLKTLSEDFENMATLEDLRIRRCPELDGAMMEKILKLQNCYIAHIRGSRKLSEKWEHMQGETEHLIVVDTGEHLRQREAARAIRVALLHGKCKEVNGPTDQLRERSSLLVGLEEGRSVTVALIMLPTYIKSHQHQTLQLFVEKARKTAKRNGLVKLQIVCARKRWGHTPTEEEERAEEKGIREILVSLGEGSCAIPSTESKRVKILTWFCDGHEAYRDELSFFMANVVDVEGRKRFQNFKFEDESAISRPPPSEIPKSIHYNSITNFLHSICPDLDRVWEIEGQSQSECPAGESKTREFMEALKSNGVHHLLIPNNTTQVEVDYLHGKTVGFIICNFKFLGCINLHQIYKDLQQKDSNFIAVWIPDRWFRKYGHGSYTRLIQCMPWATFPHPLLFEHCVSPDPRFVVLDKHGQIAKHDALPLLLGWGAMLYPFTQRTIRESFSLMESESCLESLFHGMNIVGRKPMKSKITFLYAAHPRTWVRMKCQLEELTQIHGNFEVLYVGNHLLMYEYLKQEYEDAITGMRWPSLSFSDMKMFWYRCEYLISKKDYKESNIKMETLHGLAKQLLYGMWIRLFVVDKDGVVTGGGYEVVQLISDGISEGERLVKEELMESLSRGECTPLVKTFFRDEIHNHPLHPQHPISCSETPRGLECDVCLKSVEDNGERLYRCGDCRWSMCGRCWRANAKHQVEQLLPA